MHFEALVFILNTFGYRANIVTRYQRQILTRKLAKLSRHQSVCVQVDGHWKL